MHVEALDFARRALAQVGPVPSAVEVGGRDINGSVRGLVAADEYLSVDLVAGPGVDLVADALTWEPDAPVDLVACTQVLEHLEPWPLLVSRMASWLAPSGWLLITCATGPWPAHSASDGGHLRPDEYYGNVDADELAMVVRKAGLMVVCHEAHTSRGDLYLLAQRG